MATLAQSHANAPAYHRRSGNDAPAPPVAVRWFAGGEEEKVIAISVSDAYSVVGEDIVNVDCDSFASTHFNHPID